MKILSHSRINCVFDFHCSSWLSHMLCHMSSGFNHKLNRMQHTPVKAKCFNKTKCNEKELVAIIGGPASIKGWSDWWYIEYNKFWMNLCLEANVFALNGAEYFGQMEMSYDEWHWASRNWSTFCR